MMHGVWVFGLFAAACGDNGTEDDLDTGADPGPWRGDLAMCGVEGSDEDSVGDCLIFGGGAGVARAGRERAVRPRDVLDEVRDRRARRVRADLL
jgi:hypothetical protein